MTSEHRPLFGKSTTSYARAGAYAYYWASLSDCTASSVVCCFSWHSQCLTNTNEQIFLYFPVVDENSFFSFYTTLPVTNQQLSESTLSSYNSKIYIFYIKNYFQMFNLKKHYIHKRTVYFYFQHLWLLETDQTFK